MNIIEAFQALKDGKNVRQNHWEEGIFISMSTDYIVWSYDPFKLVSFHPNHFLYAWEIYEEPEEENYPYDRLRKKLAETDVEKLAEKLQSWKALTEKTLEKRIEALEDFYKQQVEMNTQQEDRINKLEKIVLVFNEGFMHIQGRIEALEEDKS